VIGFGTALSLGASRSSGTPTPTPAPVWRNVIRAYGPGNAAGGLSGGTAGTQTQTDTYVNESGTILTSIKAVLTGWAAQLNAADLVCPSSYDALVEVEYPVSSGFQTLANLTVPPGDTVVCGAMAPTTPIPAGASFRIRTTAVLTTGQKVPLAHDGTSAKFRVAGILAEHSRPNVIALGDSIMTNNGQPSRAAAVGIMPVCQLALIGATGYQTAPQIARTVALATALGATHAVCNHQANDHSVPRTLVQLQDMANTIADAFDAVGIATIWMTGTPKTTVANQGGSATTASGITTLTLSTGGAAAKFAVDEIYNLTAAATASRNGWRKVTAVNTGANTVSFFDPLSADGTDANTVTINTTRGYLAHQTPQGTSFTGGSASRWAQFNAWLKTHPGNIADHIAIDEEMSAAIDDPRWLPAPLDGFLRPIKPSLTVSAINLAGTSGILTFTSDGDTYPDNWATNGRVLWLTGAKAGLSFIISNSTTARAIHTDTVSAAIGDTFAIIPYAGIHGSSGDGLHPDIGTGTFGASRKIQAIYAAKYAELVA
jgi:hypothetical protein